MIPKNIFFIWIGDLNKFKYQNNIEMFKKMNPTFSIKFIVSQSIESTNDDIKECFNIINTQSDSVYAAWYNRPWALDNYNKNMSKIIRFCDAFRLFLLNKYGGIYLDTDIIPLKPFDDKFLNCDSRTLICRDNYFFAMKRGYIDTLDFSNLCKYNELSFSEEHNKIQENLYFKHIPSRSWK